MYEFIGWIQNKDLDEAESSQAQIIRNGAFATDYQSEDVTLGYRTITNDADFSGLQCDFGQYKVAFNGKILDFNKTKEELVQKGYTFTTDLEAELVAHLFNEYKEQAFNKIRGHFTLLIWDEVEKSLYGARDSFGIKPLFYYEGEEGIAVASNKKLIVELLNQPAINKVALQQYMSFQYIPEPYTITENVNKLPGGHYFVKKLNEPLQVVQYFDVTFEPVLQEKDKWIKEIREAIYESVASHIEGEKSIGSFLSSGIDSTILATIATELNPSFKTFSIGFDNQKYSEAHLAKITADKIGVENISYIVSAEEYVSKLPEIMWYMDEPLADPACVPLYFIAREAKKHVNVALSGEGADELFGGYNIYCEPDSLKTLNALPSVMKKMLHIISRILPNGFRGKSFLERGTTPLRERYIGNAKMFEPSEHHKYLTEVSPEVHYHNITGKLYDRVSNEPLMNQMQYIDLNTWGRGDILLKADKMLLANGLELRSPFLDKAVYNVSRKLPTELKVNNGTTKYMLREAVNGIIPDHVLNKRKLGFPVPTRDWLKAELNGWAKQLIKESETDYLIHKSAVLELLDAHCQGKGDYSRKVWTLLIFMIWHQVFVEGKYPELEKPKAARLFV